MSATTAAVEPVAWDPHSRIDPSTPLTDLPVCGVAVATAGLGPTAPLLGIQTAARGPDGPDVRYSLFRPDLPLPTDGHAARFPTLQHRRRCTLGSAPVIEEALDDDAVHPTSVEPAMLLVHSHLSEAAGLAQSAAGGVEGEDPRDQLPEAQTLGFGDQRL